MPHETSLLAELRRKIKDTTRSVRAFSLAVDSSTASSALAEVTGGRLIVTVASGSTPDIDLSLTDPRYDTIGKLTQAISRTPGYAVQLSQDAGEDHASFDLESFGPLDITKTGVTLSHHLFSDLELNEILASAISRHNPSLTVATLPPQENVFVLMLAQADVARAKAQDASKRRGLDSSVSDLLSIASAFDIQYQQDVARLSRAIQSPKEANPNTMDEGDIVMGLVTRRSLRNGYTAPIAGTRFPEDVILLDPDDRDVEDDNIRLTWQRNKDYQFYSYELWMDSRPEVQRAREGAQAFAGSPIAYRTSEDTIQDPAARATTSVMVFRSLGANSNSSRSSFSTFVEEFGQLIKNFAVGNLEPDTTYYFRLFVTNLNYVSAGSNMVSAKTKPLRCRFLAGAPDPIRPQQPYGSALSTTSAAFGSTVTVTCDSSKGVFTSDHRFQVGEKPVTPTILTPYSFSFVVPSFQTIGLKGLTIISPTGLVDVYRPGLRVTAS